MGSLNEEERIDRTDPTARSDFQDQARRHRLMPLKTIKLAVSDEMITQLDSRAELEGMPRSELIRRTLSGQLHPMVLENYAKTCADVLRATNGKLSPGLRSITSLAS